MLQSMMKVDGKLGFAIMIGYWIFVSNIRNMILHFGLKAQGHFSNMTEQSRK